MSHTHAKWKLQHEEQRYHEEIIPPRQIQSSSIDRIYYENCISQSKIYR